MTAPVMTYESDMFEICSVIFVIHVILLCLFCCDFSDDCIIANKSYEVTRICWIFWQKGR